MSLIIVSNCGSVITTSSGSGSVITSCAGSACLVANNSASEYGSLMCRKGVLVSYVVIDSLSSMYPGSGIIY